MRAFRIGESASLTRTITEDDVLAFARLTGDTNPLHLDEAYARTTRFGRRIVQGLLTAGFISALLGTELPGPGAVYLEQSLRFVEPVHLGDTVTVTVEVTAYRKEKGVLTLRTECFNQHGKQVISGQAVLLVG
jgi:3-hydroxybutyryl-CoA dehydratase